MGQRATSQTATQPIDIHLSRLAAVLASKLQLALQALGPSSHSPGTYKAALGKPRTRPPMVRWPKQLAPECQVAFDETARHACPRKYSIGSPQDRGARDRGSRQVAPASARCLNPRPRNKAFHVSVNTRFLNTCVSFRHMIWRHRIPKL